MVELLQSLNEALKGKLSIHGLASPLGRCDGHPARRMVEAHSGVRLVSVLPSRTACPVGLQLNLSLELVSVR